MANAHLNPAITPRPPAELRDRAKVAAAMVDSNVSALVVDFLRWLVHDHDELPPRPARPVPPVG